MNMFETFYGDGTFQGMWRQKQWLEKQAARQDARKYDLEMQRKKAGNKTTKAAASSGR